MQTRSWWGWGHTAKALSDEECVQLANMLPGLPGKPVPIPAVADLTFRPSRVAIPASLAEILSTTPEDRAAHTYGKAYRDVVRALNRQMDHAPDVVALPRTEPEIIDILDWAGHSSLAVIPYGGGSSVVGGVEYRGADHAGVISLDLSNLDKVLEVDETSRSARIQAGIFGPALEDQLRPRGYTLRHFPQSFEFSTLGGWLATRAGGHYATLHTRIDDFVESMRVLTPAGTLQSWRLPGSGAGPSPDRLFLGSEGTLGIITEAWMRIQHRPHHRASAAVSLPRFSAAVEAVRAIAQSGLHPANCRLLDPGEALFSGAGDGQESVLVLGFESASQPVDDLLAQALDIAWSCGGRRDTTDRGHQGATAAWRSAFLRMPYLRDGLTRMSAIVETFETATTWDRTIELVDVIRSDLARTIERVCGMPATINCRFTHLYPDGPAPYFTVIVAGRSGSELPMWDEIKAAACDILNQHQATITHHHAVGRDHRPWYGKQRSDLFAAAIRAAKHALDPQGILNPGVLFD